MLIVFLNTIQVFSLAPSFESHIQLLFHSVFGSVPIRLYSEAPVSLPFDGGADGPGAGFFGTHAVKSAIVIIVAMAADNDLQTVLSVLLRVLRLILNHILSHTSVF
jgi:hypothetical protein